MAMNYDNAVDFQNSVSREIAKFHLKRVGKTSTDNEIEEWLHTANMCLSRDVLETMVNEYWEWYMGGKDYKYM